MKIPSLEKQIIRYGYWYLKSLRKSSELDWITVVLLCYLILYKCFVEYAKTTLKLKLIKFCSLFFELSFYMMTPVHKNF